MSLLRHRPKLHPEYSSHRRSFHEILEGECKKPKVCEKLSSESIGYLKADEAGRALNKFTADQLVDRDVIRHFEKEFKKICDMFFERKHLRTIKKEIAEGKFNVAESKLLQPLIKLYQAIFNISEPDLVNSGGHLNKGVARLLKWDTLSKDGIDIHSPKITGAIVSSHLCMIQGDIFTALTTKYKAEAKLNASLLAAGKKPHSKLTQEDFDAFIMFMGLLVKQPFYSPFNSDYFEERVREKRRNSATTVKRAICNKLMFSHRRPEKEDKDLDRALNELIRRSSDSEHSPDEYYEFIHEEFLQFVEGDDHVNHCVAHIEQHMDRYNLHRPESHKRRVYSPASAAAAADSDSSSDSDTAPKKAKASASRLSFSPSPAPQRDADGSSDSSLSDSDKESKSRAHSPTDSDSSPASDSDLSDTDSSKASSDGSVSPEMGAELARAEGDSDASIRSAPVPARRVPSATLEEILHNLEDAVNDEVALPAAAFYQSVVDQGLPPSVPSRLDDERASQSAPSAVVTIAERTLPGIPVPVRVASGEKRELKQTAQGPQHSVTFFANASAAGVATVERDGVPSEVNAEASVSSVAKATVTGSHGIKTSIFRRNVRAVVRFAANAKDKVSKTAADVEARLGRIPGQSKGSKNPNLGGKSGGPGKGIKRVA